MGMEFNEWKKHRKDTGDMELGLQQDFGTNRFKPAKVELEGHISTNFKSIVPMLIVDPFKKGPIENTLGKTLAQFDLQKVKITIEVME